MKMVKAMDEYFIAEDDDLTYWIADKYNADRIEIKYCPFCGKLIKNGL